MSKRIAQSNCRDPENRSKKRCACGGHSTQARKKKRRWGRKEKKAGNEKLKKGRHYE